MPFTPICNPTEDQLRRLLEVSRDRTARRITDRRSGDLWYWPAEQATHAEGATALGVPYDLRPGEGEIVTLG